jgi:probable F420-dependent oxidoreductase
MRIGVVFPQNEIGPGREVAVEFAHEAEAAGYEYLLVYDHVLGADIATRPDWSGTYSSRDQFHEPFVLLAHLAGLTSLEFLTGVLVLPQRQTVLVAKQASELDLLSCGRLRLGVGLGWNRVEYQGLGIDFTNRGKRLEEQIEVLRLLWANESVNFRGRFHVIDRAGIQPRPHTQSIPVWIGTLGTSQEALRRIGRVADGWLPQMAPGDRLRSANDTVKHAAIEAGRDPDSIALEGRIRVRPDDDGPSVVRQVKEWGKAGASFVAVDTLKSGLTPQGHLRRIAEVAAYLDR